MLHSGWLTEQDVRHYREQMLQNIRHGQYQQGQYPALEQSTITYVDADGRQHMRGSGTTVRIVEDVIAYYNHPLATAERFPPPSNRHPQPSGKVDWKKEGF